MNLKIEKWLSTGSYSPGTKQLFQESFLCYKTGAYRASLLYSYLGFLTILKERLTIADKPSDIVIGQWTKLQKNIQNENHWEEAVFDSTQNSSSPLFQIDEHVRLQIKYWKDRRNDSVHFKENEISEHHVESLWSFIQSNLSKITVEGGKDSLINKFDKHFDPTRTKPGRDYLNLIKDIESSMGSTSIPSFLNSLRQIIDRYLLGRTEFFNICHLIFTNLNAAFVTATINYLRNTNDLYFHLIQAKPLLTNYFNFTSEEIRTIWRTKLIVHPNNLSLLASFLRNDLIPDDEMDDAFSYFLAKSTLPPERNDDNVILLSKGFYQLVYRRFITDGAIATWGFANPKRFLFIELIKLKGLSEEVVSSICSTFNNGYYPFSLKDELNNFFTERADINARFKQIVTEQGLTLPAYIPSLNN